MEQNQIDEDGFHLLLTLFFSACEEKVPFLVYEDEGQNNPTQRRRDAQYIEEGRAIDECKRQMH